VNGRDHDGGDDKDAEKAGERRRSEQVHRLLRADTKDDLWLVEVPPRGHQQRAAHNRWHWMRSLCLM
jgi:hypothetical protein